MTAIRPLIDYKNKKRRGMSVMYDLLDWVGGFPYEFASYSVLNKYMYARKFKLEKGRENTSLGCHEMVYLKK